MKESRHRMTPPRPNPGEIRKGAAFYNARGLFIYNLYVLRFNNRFLWRCPRRRLLRHYDQHIRCNHLDIGPGTGWYLQHVAFPCRKPRVTLLDLSPDSLATASRRLRKLSPVSINADIYSPIPTDEKFDSVAANYVFHCIPGDWDTKSLAIEHIAAVLSPDGVFFGSTILGQGVHHNRLGRRTMARFNASGTFHNQTDDLAGLQKALDTYFEQYTTTMVGKVALFSATRPRTAT
ncbi:class I SAM-dependent methyltransferase [Mycolicibacterium tusciae]